MNVLSLFDGMSGGQIVLDELGINVENYYSSEIKPHAIKVSNKNYPNTIQLGDIEDINKAFLKTLPKIDLVIGGSPCQGFSVCGKQLNFEDHRSKLFFEYVRILNWIKENNNAEVKFFLENVRMKKEWLDIISKYLGVKPIKINSAKYTAQRRFRYYWFNWGVELDTNTENIVFKDIMQTENIPQELYIPGKYKFDIRDNTSGSPKTTMRLGGYKKQGQGQRLYSIDGKSVTLTANGGGWGAKTGLYLTENGIRQPTIKELCRLQGVPDNYFDGLNLSYNQICNLIGDGWTIPVVKDIFKVFKKI